MSTVEERKKERIKKGIEIALQTIPAIGLATKVAKVAKLLKGKLTPKKELDLNQLIKDLKSKKKLSKGDRGAAESIPKKKADFNVFLGNIKNAKPVSRQYKGQQSLEIEVAKGGKIKTYSKGGGVRKPKMTAGY